MHLKQNLVLGDSAAIVLYFLEEGKKCGYKHDVLIRLSFCSNRIVFSTRRTRIHRFVCSMKEVYVPRVHYVAVGGILHLMVQNVKIQRPLKELFTADRQPHSRLVPVILKATVIGFAKVRYVWNSE